MLAGGGGIVHRARRRQAQAGSRQADGEPDLPNAAASNSLPRKSPSARLRSGVHWCPRSRRSRGPHGRAPPETPRIGTTKPKMSIVVPPNGPVMRVRHTPGHRRITIPVPGSPPAKPRRRGRSMGRMTSRHEDPSSSSDGVPASFNAVGRVPSTAPAHRGEEGKQARSGHTACPGSVHGASSAERRHGGPGCDEHPERRGPCLQRFSLASVPPVGFPGAAARPHRNWAERTTTGDPVLTVPRPCGGTSVR